jgi:hypothetical protein
MPAVACPGGATGITGEVPGRGAQTTRLGPGQGKARHDAVGTDYAPPRAPDTGSACATSACCCASAATPAPIQCSPQRCFRSGLDGPCDAPAPPLWLRAPANSLAGAARRAAEASRKATQQPRRAGASGFGWVGRWLLPAAQCARGLRRTEPNRPNGVQQPAGWMLPVVAAIFFPSPPDAQGFKVTLRSQRAAAHCSRKRKASGTGLVGQHLSVADSMTASRRAPQQCWLTPSHALTTKWLVRVVDRPSLLFALFVS